MTLIQGPPKPTKTYFLVGPRNYRLGLVRRTYKKVGSGSFVPYLQNSQPSFEMSFRASFWALEYTVLGFGFVVTIEAQKLETP